jgi:hypothetical protein
MNSTYLDTARMLVQVAPLVFRESPFALKGRYRSPTMLRGNPIGTNACACPQLRLAECEPLLLSVAPAGHPFL